VIDFLMEKPVVFAAGEIPDDILFSIPGRPEKNIGLPFPSFSLDIFPPDYADYLKAFRHVQNEIRQGNTFLLNLTFESKIKTELSLKEIYRYSRAKYKLYFRDEFTVFSPECFIKINNGIISSYPMKGTIDAAIEEAERRLLEDEKETAEHNTIVDLIRNDLSMTAENVDVESFRYIEKISTHKGELLQMSSKISGKLPHGFQNKLGEILITLLPAGSISGAPKQKTLEIIREAENYPRNYYTGIFGYFDGQNLDSAVMIRFVEKRNDTLWFKSGGGITSMSNPQKEYEELLQKIYVPIA
jgi:para-aminobenzoate synthetase component 1